jgi:P-type E1-E2 ATPase
MALQLEIPGRGSFDLEVLLLDVNGTLSDRGELIEGVAAKLSRLRAAFEICLLSADTFGTLDAIARELDVAHRRVGSAAEKLEALEAFGADRSAAVGNGANDVEMLAAAALGIAVIGPEGASSAALMAADVVCRSVTDALDLLADPHALTATLRR